MRLSPLIICFFLIFSCSVEKELSTIDNLHVLIESLSSDDMQGRNEALNSIVKGYPIPRPGTPESFKVLLRELQALCLDIATYKISDESSTLNDKEINLIKNIYIIILYISYILAFMSEFWYRISKI